MQEKSTPKHRHSARVVRQLRLPIADAPEPVRRHGLCDAHSRPLVSPGKIDGGGFRMSFRVAPWAAWHFPSLEIRAENSYTSLILDFDGWDSYKRLMEEVKGAHVGDLNWGVENLLTGGVHGVWTLANPVHRADTALEAPLRLFGRISEYYAARLGADEGYKGVLTHNPMEDAQLRGFKTHWLRKEPYTLGELASFIPFRWRRPKVSRTAAGRNCDLFSACMKWAGSALNLGVPVLSEAARVNRAFRVPLDPPEVRGLSRSVERYRRKWIKQGRFYSKTERTAWGRERGVKSGQARRKRTKERDQAIIQAVGSGQSIRSVARDHGLRLFTVQNVLKRDAPLFARPEPLTLTRPWEAEGVPRRTWYRRRGTSDQRTTQVSPGK